MITSLLQQLACLSSLTSILHISHPNSKHPWITVYKNFDCAQHEAQISLPVVQKERKLSAVCISVKKSKKARLNILTYKPDVSSSLGYNNGGPGGYHAGGGGGDTYRTKSGGIESKDDGAGGGGGGGHFSGGGGGGGGDGCSRTGGQGGTVSAKV